MNYERFYDSSSRGLRTEKDIDSSDLASRVVGQERHNSPITRTSTWYRGLIDADCFPETAHVYYLIGQTGPETRVDLEAVGPKGGTFEVK